MMRTRIMVVAFLAALVTAAFTSTAAAVVPPHPSVICANCEPGYSCVVHTVGSGGGPFTGGEVYANLHWCTDLAGNVWDVYGWPDHNNTCCEPAVRWEGYNFAYQGGWSFHVRGQYALSVWTPIFGWITVQYDYPQADICIDGYGGWWSC